MNKRLLSNLFVFGFIVAGIRADIIEKVDWERGDFEKNKRTEVLRQCRNALEALLLCTPTGPASQSLIGQIERHCPASVERATKVHESIAHQVRNETCAKLRIEHETLIIEAPNNCNNKCIEKAEKLKESYIAIKTIIEKNRGYGKFEAKIIASNSQLCQGRANAAYYRDLFLDL